MTAEEHVARARELLAEAELRYGEMPREGSLPVHAPALLALAHFHAADWADEDVNVEVNDRCVDPSCVWPHQHRAAESDVPQ